MTDREYKEAIKLYKSLHCPSDTLNIIGDILPYEKAWNMILSPRSRGKTTNLILWGMCLNATCGTQIQYIRQRDSQLVPKLCGKLCDVINMPKYKYIEKITNGRYNNVWYYGRKWYYRLIDENGEVIEKSETPFMSCIAVDQNQNLKSVYNAPNGDFIIFDEFLTKNGYLPDEFVLLNDLLSTIIRQRDTASIYLVGNLIDKYSIYFDELYLTDIIQEITWGEHRNVNCGGTELHLFTLPLDMTAKRQKVNKKYFGWNNQMLTSITGNKGLWQMKQYPKPPKGDFEVIDKAYIYKNGKYCAREIRKDETNHLYIMIYSDTYGYNPERHILYTLNSKVGYNKKIRFGLGFTYTDDCVKRLILAKRIFFADNSCGAFLDSYIKDISTYK